MYTMNGFKTKFSTVISELLEEMNRMNWTGKIMEDNEEQEEEQIQGSLTGV